MTIHALRILPPLAIARLGSAAEPLDNFTVEVDPDHPLDFRQIRPDWTLRVDAQTGEIVNRFMPGDIEFKTADEKIRPVAPFLEVFAETGADTLEPLTLDLLAGEGLGPEDVKWTVMVANRKVARRTDNPKDVVQAKVPAFSDHLVHPLEGHCANFVRKTDFIHFGDVRYIKPTTAFPEIRLRFAPAAGHIYGSNKVDEKVIPNEDEIIPPERRVYDATKGWYLFEVPPDIDSGGGGREPGARFWNETFPPSLFAIVPPAPSWLHGNVAKSRGYLDDACDGSSPTQDSCAAWRTTSSRRCSAPPSPRTSPSR
jgi:hypothetical protein